MKLEEKVKRISSLKEQDLRSKLVVPLFRAAGFVDVRVAHGTLERGKDVLFREINKLGEAFTGAAVVSTHDINGAVGDDASARRALEQAEMVLDEPYKDPSTGKETKVDRCWIITSGTISTHAIESVSGKLQGPLGRMVRFVDQARMIELTDQHYPEFWQRDPHNVYISRFENIDISTNQLAPPYDHEIDDLPVFGNLTDAVYKLKKILVRILDDFDEPKDIIIDILESNHPWQIIGLLEDLETHIDSHGHIPIGTRDLRGFSDELYQDVNDYEEKARITPDDRNTPRKIF